jgi:hypothetical protein
MALPVLRRLTIPPDRILVNLHHGPHGAARHRKHLHYRQRSFFRLKLWRSLCVDVVTSSEPFDRSSS